MTMQKAKKMKFFIMVGTVIIVTIILAVPVYRQLRIIHTTQFRNIDFYNTCAVYNGYQTPKTLNGKFYQCWDGFRHNKSEEPILKTALPAFNRQQKNALTEPYCTLLVNRNSNIEEILYIHFYKIENKNIFLPTYKSAMFDYNGIQLLAMIDGIAFNCNTNVFKRTLNKYEYTWK